MGDAVRSAVRVRGAKRRNASSNHRRNMCKGLLRGLVATALVCTTVATALAATSRLFSVSVEVRQDTRSLVGLTSRDVTMPYFAWRDGGTVPQALVDTSAPDTIPASSRGRAHGTLALAALPSSGTLTDLSDDTLFTGAIGDASARFDSTNATPRFRFESPAPNDDPEPVALPMPRSRPKLASLPPAGDIKLTPDADEIPLKTAIYDISAKTVYMPNGERLEAHSGFGKYMDDPKHVRLRMRGVTPPNTYRLTMREALFHGVEAIRMNPEDQPAMFGRNGILAHPYMLGPNGQSNGCMSVKDYSKFLAAFKRGEVNRVIVVFRMSKPPSMLARRGGKNVASAL